MSGFLTSLKKGAISVLGVILEGVAEGQKYTHNKDIDQQLINEQLLEEKKKQEALVDQYKYEVERCLLDLRQIALAAAKRGIRDKRSYHGYTLVIAHGCSRMWSAGNQLTEAEKREVPLGVLRKFRTHFNHLVVPA